MTTPRLTMPLRFMAALLWLIAATGCAVERGIELQPRGWDQAAAAAADRELPLSATELACRPFGARVVGRQLVVDYAVSLPPAVCKEPYAVSKALDALDMSLKSEETLALAVDGRASGFFMGKLRGGGNGLSRASRKWIISFDRSAADPCRGVLSVPLAPDRLPQREVAITFLEESLPLLINRDGDPRVPTVGVLLSGGGVSLPIKAAAADR